MRPTHRSQASSYKNVAPARGSTVRGVLQPLLLDLIGVLPDDLARARVDELEAVLDVIAGALRGARGEAAELAGQEVIRAAKFDHVGIAARGDLAAALQIALAFQRLHPVAGEKRHAVDRLPVERDAN